jgi:hypothetical protein
MVRWKSRPSAQVTVVTLVPCFAASTKIATPRGKVMVEALQPGDQVLTVLGAVLPIVWAGRDVDCANYPELEQERPIHIQALAFAQGVPHRNLFSSSDHAILAEGVLFPIKEAINRTTICQLDNR